MSRHRGGPVGKDPSRKWARRGRVSTSLFGASTLLLRIALSAAQHVLIPSACLRGRCIALGDSEPGAPPAFAGQDCAVPAAEARHRISPAAPEHGVDLPRLKSSKICTQRMVACFVETLAVLQSQ
jgi:hypothetical protein